MANQEILTDAALVPSSLARPNYFDSPSYIEESASSERFYAENRQNSVPWDKLPPEILLEIFSYLDVHDKENVEKTCHTWMHACLVPSLWNELKLHFTNGSLLETLREAYRSINLKGHYLRRLIIKIGPPSVSHALLMSRCIQDLFEFISHHPSNLNIEHFSLNNLNFSEKWRFFTVSKKNILGALNAFLSQQKSLTSIDFSRCRLSAPDGMRLLRSLKYSQCHCTVRHLELRDFFQKNYKAVRGCRFSVTLCTSLLALQEIGLNAKHLNEATLQMLTEKSICRRRLRHLRIFFESDRMPRNFISKRCWQEARESCPELRVSVYITGCIARMTNTFWAETMPVSHCNILWRLNQGTDLAFLIQYLGQHYSKTLVGFHLDSRIGSNLELDLAMLYLTKRCTYLADLEIVKYKVHKDVAKRITNIIAQRPFKVKISLKSSRMSLPGKMLC